MTAVFGTAVDERGQAVKIGGFGIGFAVTFDILAGGPITGTLMNPDRSFGPALVCTAISTTGTCSTELRRSAALLYHHVLLDPLATKSSMVAKS